MSSTGTKKIYVIFYTTYGHIYKLVEEVAKGINSVAGTEAVVLQVAISLLACCCACVTLGGILSTFLRRSYIRMQAKSTAVRRGRDVDSAHRLARSSEVIRHAVA